MQPSRSRVPAALGALALAAVLSPARAQDLASFEKHLTQRTLDNGLTLLVYERPEAPVVSFYTYVNAGSAQEVPGITGLAHMFEHMAFKGTTRIGTTDWNAEKTALAAVDRAYHAYDSERRKAGGADSAKLADLERAFKDAQEAAGAFVVKNEFGEIIDREGGTGLNASTASDATLYYYSLPANKVELWAYLESERFLDPVLREFYKERDVVMEERRLRVDSNPIGGLIEEFLAAAFRAHPYGQAGIGWVSDLTSFSREDAETFFRTWYVPNNMTIAVVGDVKAAQVMPILEKYFGRLPRGPEPEPLRTVEPPQKGEVVVTVPNPAQPIYVEGYHRPAAGTPDDAVYDALADVLSTDRTSRLYRSLVRDKKIAAASGAFNGFPGSKYPNLMIFYAVPTPGHSNEEVQAAIREEIERLKSAPVTDDELRMVKTRAKANLIRGLDSNQGLAGQIATYQALFGDWRELFRSVDKIDKVTKEDIQRVARATLVPTNRTVGMIVNQAAQ
ncbi:MAG TPA: pitrilysin family protein [Candidatus Polarisedimenticolaceae bacterium]|nr:pitrilysin family protein [Candidatus Polarisedimenticolaceae bacterium]